MLCLVAIDGTKKIGWNYGIIVTMSKGYYFQEKNNLKKEDELFLPNPFVVNDESNCN